MYTYWFDSLWLLFGIGGWLVAALAAYAIIAECAVIAELRPRSTPPPSDSTPRKCPEPQQGYFYFDRDGDGPKKIGSIHGVDVFLMRSHSSEDFLHFCPQWSGSVYIIWATKDR